MSIPATSPAGSEEPAVETPAADAGANPSAAAETTEGAPDSSVEQPALTAEESAVLKAYGITPDAEGRITVGDHLKLINTVKTLREEIRASGEQAEKSRLESLPDQERLIEQAKAEARAEVEAQYRSSLVKTQAESAAIAAGFADPADIAGFLDLSSLTTEEEVKAAVLALAETKPYLLKKATPSAPPIGQGPKAPANPIQSPSDWLRSAVMRGGHL